MNAAGCGSAMKEYGHAAARRPGLGRAGGALASRVRDVTSCSPSPAARGAPAAAPEVAYHDACHLAHAQGVREQPRELLRSIPGLELVEPDEWEICCGSAGIYNLLQPEPAAELGERKARNLLATGAEMVAAANPGCALQIRAHRALGHPLPCTTRSSCWRARSRIATE